MKFNVGELRPSQMMFTYGVGSIVDLPHFSVLVMGLDDWDVGSGHTTEINEARLLEAVRFQLGRQVNKLLSPPATSESAGFTNPFDPIERVGIPVATFPRWMLCPRCRTLAPLSSGLFELKHNPFHPERSHYVHSNCRKARKPPPVVPARFLVACPDGHLDDFPWVEFTHRGPTTRHSLLRLVEYGAGGEARDVEVRCETCGSSRRLAEAFGASGEQNMPICRGRRPHLRDYLEGGCDQQVKAILLGASNLWFPEVLTTLALPGETSSRLDALVDEQWARLNRLQSLQNVELLRSLGQLGDFHGYSDQQVWDAIQRHRQQDGDEPSAPAPMDLKTPEWEVFLRPEVAPVTEDFRLRAVEPPPAYSDLIEQVVLAEKLREVRALIGFTRIDAPGEWGGDHAGGRAPRSPHPRRAGLGPRGRDSRRRLIHPFLRGSTAGLVAGRSSPGMGEAIL